MKKLVLPCAILFVTSVLPGCPIYGGSSSDHCLDASQCPEGSACDTARGVCVLPSTCDSPLGCRNNETCSRRGRCVVGDCTFEQIGCIVGYVCDAPRGFWECVREDSQDGGASGGGGAASLAGAGDAGLGGVDAGSGGAFLPGGASGTGGAGSGG